MTSTFEEEKKDQDYNKRVYGRNENHERFDRPDGFVQLD